MVVLRPTKKLRAALPTADVTAPSDTALGDWYVNRVVVNRHPLLLLVSSTSLLSVLLPARDVRGLPSRLGSVVAARLRRLAIEPDAIQAEVQAMHPVVVAPTVDRSVLGIAVDFAKAIPYYSVSAQPRTLDLEGLEDWLAETPCHASLGYEKVVFPCRKAPDLLQARWMAVRPRETPTDPGPVVR